MIIVITQLIIISAWLLAYGSVPLGTLGIWSLYGQWTVIISCLALCLARGRIAKVNYWAGVAWVVLICFGALAFVELLISYWSPDASPWRMDYDRFARLALVAALVVGVLLRFFAFLSSMESRNMAESRSRIEALQSRIQPHFLFNSLNTISELTATEPEQAEKAISSLSMLFRASLENNRKTHSLENELNLCRRYIELERWRVGGRLNIAWSMHVNDAAKWSVPKLILQPLIENAIFHGVQRDGAIDIMVDVRETDRHLSLMIENEKGSTDQESKGHGIAIDNIRERLFVLYDDQQTFRIKDADGRYSVLMRIPKLPYKAKVVGA